MSDALDYFTIEVLLIDRLHTTIDNFYSVIVRRDGLLLASIENA
jgi:hypothetical protein